MIPRFPRSLSLVSAALVLVSGASPGRTGEVKRLAQGVEIPLEEGTLRLQVWGERTLRVLFTPRGGAFPRPSLVVLPGGREKTAWSVKEGKDALEVSTRLFRARVDLPGGRVTFMDGAGGVLLREAPGGRKTARSEVCGESVFHAAQAFSLSGPQALFGLGQHQQGWANLRGRKILLFQRNMEVALPVLISTRGWGILWDNASLTEVDCREGVSFHSRVADGVDYYFFYGPGPGRVVAAYRKLTGRAPLFPRWAYGYVQCKERYKTQAELISVVAEYRKRRIPLDLIVQDWHYWPRGMWGQKSFDASRYPDPAGLCRILHEKYHARVMISIWPRLARNCPDWKEMDAHPGFLYPGKKVQNYDAFNPAARRLFWRQAFRGIFSKGFDAWWADATEPELAGWRWEPAFSERTMKPWIGTGARYLNAYPLEHCRGLYEGQRSVTSKKRVLILTRSAFPGQQRYAAATWSGDVTAGWDVFRRQIPAGLNFCAAGIPYWTTDIGGFFTRKNYPKGCGDDAYRELYLRWFQFGAFCPMFRSHGTNTPREVWRFGEPGGWCYDALVEADKLRYRLLPYIYSTAWMVTSKGYTMMRHPALDFPEDEKTWDLGDQFMFGPALLVCPVTEPFRFGVKERKKETRRVHLPCGTAWFDFWTGREYEGGVEVDAAAPLDRIPLFVRAGSIVPMGPFLQYTDEKKPDPLEIRVYPGADGDFTLYEDEGDGYGYEKGERAEIPFRWDEGRRTLLIGARKGRFPGMLESRVFRVILVAPGRGFGAAPSEEALEVPYGGKRVEVPLNPR